MTALMGDSGYSSPSQSPLYHAVNANRYDRQRIIAEYQDRFYCKLAVMNDVIFDHSVILFEEMIYDGNSTNDLHIILNSPGGDGETAVRLIRIAQARCKELTIIIPDQAKSAATLMTLGAHHILMGPASDLGPIDPQFPFQGGLVSAKDIIAAVEDSAARVREAPETYPIYASLLGDLNALMFQQAQSALKRTSDQLGEALRSNPDRSDNEVNALKDKLVEPLIERPKTHSALFSAEDAKKAGLPVAGMDVTGEQWQMIWRLWTKYYVIGPPIYEGERVSHTSIPEVRPYSGPLN